VKDRVQMGSFIVPNQTFAIIINELEERKHKNNIFREIDFQGLLGLGFPSLSTDGMFFFFFFKKKKLVVAFIKMAKVRLPFLIKSWIKYQKKNQNNLQFI
jgi:hypothetical protein